MAGRAPCREGPACWNLLEPALLCVACLFNVLCACVACQWSAVSGPLCAEVSLEAPVLPVPACVLPACLCSAAPPSPAAPSPCLAQSLFRRNINARDVQRCNVHFSLLINTPGHVLHYGR